MGVLIYGDTERSLALRHEVPLAIGDPFLYLEAGGRRAVLTTALEEARITRAALGIECVLVETLGWDELVGAGFSHGEAELELCARAVEAFGITRASVPFDFPVGLADRLRAGGVEIVPDERLFSERRRQKTIAELAGVRRAAVVAVAAMGEGARLLREATIDGERLLVDRVVLTAEPVRARIREVCAQLGAPAPADIMIRAMGVNPPLGHDPGSGPLPAHVPIEIDLWPLDEASGCWADMTRTFIRGEISEPIAKLHALVLDAHERACRAVRPGVTGRELNDLACEVFEAAGHPTQRTKVAGHTLREGFYWGLGHGVGLAVHEDPQLWRAGNDALISNDVIAVEPGTIIPGIGGTSVEDLLIVTTDGSERLTGQFAYTLTP
jgi:Xaa-Pro aminopeptidase